MNLEISIFRSKIYSVLEQYGEELYKYYCNDNIVKLSQLDIIVDPVPEYIIGTYSLDIEEGFPIYYTFKVLYKDVHICDLEIETNIETEHQSACLKFLLQDKNAPRVLNYFKTTYGLAFSNYMIGLPTVEDLTRILGLYTHMKINY